MGVKIDAINKRIDEIEEHLDRCPIKVNALAIYQSEVTKTFEEYKKVHLEILGFRKEFKDVRGSLDQILGWMEKHV